MTELLSSGPQRSGPPRRRPNAPRWLRGRSAVVWVVVAALVAAAAWALPVLRRRLADDAARWLTTRWTSAEGIDSARARAVADAVEHAGITDGPAVRAVAMAARSEEARALTAIAATLGSHRSYASDVADAARLVRAALTRAADDMVHAATPTWQSYLAGLAPDPLGPAAAEAMSRADAAVAAMDRRHHLPAPQVRTVMLTSPAGLLRRLQRPTDRPTGMRLSLVDTDEGTVTTWDLDGGRPSERTIPANTSSYSVGLGAADVPVVSGDKVLLGFADSWRLLNLDDGRISRLPAASQYFATGTDQLWQANAVAVRSYDAATGRAGTWHRFPAGATPMEGTSTASPHLIGLRLPGGGNGFDAVWVPGTGAITPFPSGCGPLVTANWTAADVECTGNAAALTVRDCATGASHRLGPPGGMMFDFAASGLLSPDGALMAQPVSRRSDQMEAAAGTALYDTRTGRLVKTLRLDGLVPLAWSRDSQRLVVAQVTDAFDAGSFATGNPLGYWDRSDERFSSIRVPVSGTPSVVVTR